MVLRFLRFGKIIIEFVGGIFHMHYATGKEALCNGERKREGATTHGIEILFGKSENSLYFVPTTNNQIPS